MRLAVLALVGWCGETGRLAVLALVAFRLCYRRTCSVLSELVGVGWLVLVSARCSGVGAVS